MDGGHLSVRNESSLCETFRNRFMNTVSAESFHSCSTTHISVKVN